jgi:hypothetical protein
MICEEFRRQIDFYLLENKHKIEEVWQDVDEHILWLRPNDQTLAPGNQLLHLSGNLRQWVLHALAGQPNLRRRDEEFICPQPMQADDVLSTFLQTMQEVRACLSSFADWEREVTVQGHATTALGVWIHMAEHLSYHTGQLIFQVKQQRGKAYHFYDGWDLG